VEEEKTFGNYVVLGNDELSVEVYLSRSPSSYGSRGTVRSKLEVEYA